MQLFMSNNENMPILTNNQSLLLENDLELDELDTAKKDMNWNKTPGTDGLPIEFYDIFWLKLRAVLLASFKYGQQTGTLYM